MDRVFTSMWAAVCFLSLVTVPARQAAAQPFPIAAQGNFQADLVFDPQIDPQVREDSLRVLRTITGIEPAVVDAASGHPAIIAGVKSFPAFQGKYDALLQNDSFQIALSNGNLHLVGATPQAAHFAVYAFLGDLGCRWFMPGAIGEVIPKQPELLWSGKPRVEEPDFSFRQIWWAYGGPPETAEDFHWWLLRNKVAFPRIAHGHNLTNTVPPSEYFDSHPEYYALIQGERTTTQLCTSNPDVVRLTIDRVNRYFDEHPDALSYSLCPDDNTDFCQCPNCTALDAGRIQEESGLPIVTDRLMVYLNAVAQGIQERHPGKMVTTYAYVNYSTPPVREKIDPYVVVVFTTSVYCSAHSIGDPSCESRRKMKRDLAGWAALSPNVYIYEYDPTPGNAELPWPMYGTHVRALPVYKAMGIRGFSFESHDSWATLFPNHYVSARMMWDADQTYDALMTDVCDRFFGKAGTAMRAYYDEMDRAIRDYHPFVPWGQRDYPQIFTDAVMTACRGHLDQAQAAEPDPQIAARLDMISMGFAYLENYLVCRNAAVEKVSYQEFRDAREKCEALIDRLYEQSKDFILAPVAHEYLNRGLQNITTDQFGAELGLVNHWMLIGPFDNAGGRGYDRTYPPETEIDLSSSYAGKDSQTVKWFGYEGPQWSGAVDLAMLMEPKEWTVAYALCYVTSPNEQEVQFRLGSNDWAKVWLNGTLVWESHLPQGRGLVLDHDVFPIALPKGTSRLLLKVCNLGNNWGFCFRITDKDGNPLKNLAYGVSPP